MGDFPELFKQSYQRILDSGAHDAFYDAFYRRFVQQSPEIAKRFENTDMAAQKAMLRDSFVYIIDFYLTEKVNEQLHKIAKSHSQKGHNIPPHLYDIWLDSLLATVKEFDDLYDRDVALAWRMALSPGITYMKFNHSQG